MSVLIFCDEFGNTGGRLLDSEQPVLVYAFMILHPAALAEVEERLMLMLRASATAPLELKSAHLLRSKRGYDRYAEIGKWLTELGARVCLSLVEKRYQACSLIRDTYLDPFEQACLRVLRQTGHLLRDQDAQFGEALDSAYAFGRELDQHPGARAYGAQRRLDSIKSCAIASSEQQLGIQLADLAAGLVGRIARDICLQGSPSEKLLRLAEAWRTTLLHMERHYVMVSDAMLAGMAPAIFGREYVRVG